MTHWTGVLGVVFIFAASKSEAERNCNDLGVHLYEELGCKPQYNKAQVCPSYYTGCNYVRPKDECTFQKGIYKLGDVLDHSLTNCDINCFCNKRDSTATPSFTCAILDCPEFFERPPLGKDCYRTYLLGKCCATGQICPPFDKDAVCKVDGATYREGQRFYPKRTCLQCICQKGFVGQLIEPFCKKRSCAFELRHAESVERNCAPVYYVEDDDKALCCPHDFICANSSDNIVKNPPKHSATSEKCKFGGHSLSVGDYVERSHSQYGKTRELKCSCDLPPYLNCVGAY